MSIHAETYALGLDEPLSIRDRFYLWRAIAPFTISGKSNGCNPALWK
ncbi:MAG: hypothetical protein HWQ38_27060 [Nostoc sp. NMS7]|nr:hypothetical protein [Nostoc sp. NMS7]MBN3949932.1 hypothetical protein [Nostoc sp. NMS7]